MSGQCALLRLGSLKRVFSTFSSLDARAPVQLTSERYPNLKRGGFAALTSDDIKIFQSILDPGSSHDDFLHWLWIWSDPGRVLTSEDGTSKYNEDWLGTVRGGSSCVLRPRDTGEVSSILAHCAARRLAICPQVWSQDSSVIMWKPSIIPGRQHWAGGRQCPRVWRSGRLYRVDDGYRNYRLGVWGGCVSGVDTKLAVDRDKPWITWRIM